MDEDILKKLERNYHQNLPVVGFFQNYNLDHKVLYNGSMILQGKSDYDWAYFSVNSQDDFAPLLKEFNYRTLYFANVEDWMVPQLSHEKRIEWKLTTHRYYLHDDVQFSFENDPCGPVHVRYVNYIYRHSAYKDFTSEQYILDRLQKDVSAGIWIDDDLAGWGLTHDDTSIGFLNVISKYRGKGIGEIILKSLIKAKRDRSLPVFVNVEQHNKESINLLKKIGFEFDRAVSWVKLRS